MQKMLKLRPPFNLLGLALGWVTVCAALLMVLMRSPSIFADWIGPIGLFLCMGTIWVCLAMVRRYKLLLYASENDKQNLKSRLEHTNRTLIAVEDQNNALLKSDPGAVVIHRDGILIYLNQAALETFCASPETALLGTPLLDWVHSECRDDELDRWKQCGSSNVQVGPYETFFLKLNNLKITVEIMHRQVTLAGGLALQTNFRDVTREREDAIKLARLTRHHRTLSGAIERHSLVVKLDVTFNVAYVNDPFVMLCGYASEQLIGKACGLLRDSAQNISVWNSMWTQVSTGRAWQGELCLKRRSGAQKWVNALVSPFLNDNGAIESYTMLLTDITEFVEAKQLARDRLLGSVAP